MVPQSIVSVKSTIVWKRYFEIELLTFNHKKEWPQSLNLQLLFMGSQTESSLPDTMAESWGASKNGNLQKI